MLENNINIKVQLSVPNDLCGLPDMAQQGHLQKLWYTCKIPRHVGKLVFQACQIVSTCPIRAGINISINLLLYLKLLYFTNPNDKKKVICMLNYVWISASSSMLLWLIKNVSLVPAWTQFFHVTWVHANVQRAKMAIWL